jgi:hypothetical protein
MRVIAKIALFAPAVIASSGLMASAISVENKLTRPWYSGAISEVLKTPITRDSSVEYVSNSSGYLKNINIETPNSSESFTNIKDYSSFIVGSNKNSNTTVEIKNTTCAYNTFGVWASGRGENNGVMGAFVEGLETNATSIPVNGKAIFSGRGLGRYVDAFGKQMDTTLGVAMNVDFSDRSIDFKTVNTIVFPLDGTAHFIDSALNLSGSLAWEQNTNAFVGTVNTTSGKLSGSAEGGFYGPSAQEAAGVFSLGANSSVESYIGSFGAIKQ